MLCRGPICCQRRAETHIVGSKAYFQALERQIPSSNQVVAVVTCNGFLSHNKSPRLVANGSNSRLWFSFAVYLES